MRVGLLLAALLLCGAEAAAQDLSIQVYDPAADLLAREVRDARRAAEEARNASAYEQSLAEGRRKRVGQMIVEGRCVEARDYALRNGEFDLVKEVQTLCSKPESSQQDPAPVK